MKTTHRRGLATLAAGIGLGLPALAQTVAFPNRPIRIIVAGAAGSAPDNAMRLLAERFSALWRQPVVVDNRPGAGGNIGAQAVARAEADGHVLLFAQATPLVLNQFLMRSMPFDPLRDFAPITLLMTTPFVIAARPGLGVASLADLVALARRSPHGLTFATSGATNLPRFTGEQLAGAAGITLVNVPYGTIAGAITDAIAGRIDLVIDGTPSLTPQVRAGALSAIAITSPARFPGLETVPAVAETYPGFAAVGWFALLAPAGTPELVITKIAADSATILAVPEIRARLLNDFGAEVSVGGPAALTAFAATERATLGRLVRELGLPLE